MCITDEEIEALLTDVYRYRTLVPGSGHDTEFCCRLALSGDTEMRKVCARIRDNRRIRDAGCVK